MAVSSHNWLIINRNSDVWFGYHLFNVLSVVSSCKWDVDSPQIIIIDCGGDRVIIVTCG